MNRNGGEGEAKERQRHQKLTPIGDVMVADLFACLFICLLAGFPLAENTEKRQCAIRQRLGITKVMLH